MSFFRFRLVLWPGCWHTINMHSWHQATKLHGHRPTTAMNQLAHFFVWVYPDCLVIIFLCFFYVVVRRWAAYVYILLWPGSRKVCISCAIATTKMELKPVQFYFFFRLKTKLRLSSMHWCLTKENETHYRWFLSACCIRKTCGLNVCIYLILVEWMNGEVKWISSLCYAFCAFATSVHLRKPTNSIGLLIRLDYFVPLYILSSVVYFFQFLFVAFSQSNWSDVFA